SDMGRMLPVGPLPCEDARWQIPLTPEACGWTRPPPAWRGRQRKGSKPSDNPRHPSLRPDGPRARQTLRGGGPVACGRLDTEEVTGSIPVSPTTKKQVRTPD